MKRQGKKRAKGKVSIGLGVILAAILLGVYLIGPIGSSADNDNPAVKKKQAATPQEKKSQKSPTASSNVTGQAGKKNSDKNRKITQKERKKETAHEEVVHKKAINHLKKEHRRKTVYLTFDDGPTLESGHLLDILDRYHAKATFFMIGSNIKAHPKVIKRMVNEGFGVGLHSMSHDANKLYSAAASAPLNEMLKAQEILQNVAAVHSQLIRLPYGSIPYLTIDMRLLLGEQHFKIWDWTVDSDDWSLKDQRYVQKTIRDIQSWDKLDQAPIVLMHDKPETIRHLPKLLTYLNNNGYHTKTLANNMAPYTFQCSNRCSSFK